MIRILAAMLIAPASALAVGRCLISAHPQQIAAEGAAEPAAAISIDCSDLTPAQALQGSISVSFSRKIANRSAGSTLDGPVLELETAAGVWAAFDAPALLTSVAGLTFSQLQWTASSAGTFRLRIRGVRVDGAAEAIQALVQVNANQRLESPNPVVTVARGAPALAAALMPTLATRGPSPAQDAKFADLVRLGSPAVAVRVSESYPSAFQAVTPGASQGTRFLLRFGGVPDGVRILLPDVITGSSALAPTRSGAFGGGAATGLISPMGFAQMVLLRVAGAEISGQGGQMVLSPGLAIQGLGQLRAAEFSRGTAFAVYEVAVSNAERLEYAEIPAWVAVPPQFDTPFGESVVRPTVSLAPLSEAEGPHPNAPTPRYRPVPPGADCELVGDCAAAWFPRMRIVEPSPLSFTAAAGSGIQIGRAGIRNEGGGLLEWRVTARTLQGTGWLTADATAGVQNGGVRYDLDPRNLSPGDYTGELQFEQLAPPNGRRDERVFQIRLTVTQPAVAPPTTNPQPQPPNQPAPTAPTPVILGVSAGPAELGPPFAPGTLVRIQGSAFGQQPQVTVGGTAARLVTASDFELGAVLPEQLAPGRTAMIVQSGGQSSAAWMIEIAAAAPVALFALNEDGERNAEPSPAARGLPLDIYVTGIRAGKAVSIRLHDRTLDGVAGDTGLPGVRLVRVNVPADLPAMQTTVVVSDDGVGSHPLDIWLR